MNAFPEVSLATEPMSEAEREKVRKQLNRLLETNHFKHSRRYPALLRFIVEETLEGRGEFLKERLLGIQVFDRPADYDTAADPIVRVTIAEIRKRIAQYYHDEEHDAEMRIELLPGRYAPEFRARSVRHEAAIETIPIVEPVSAPVDLTLSEPMTDASPDQTREIAAKGSRSLGLLWALAGAILAVVCLLGATPLWGWIRPSPIEQLWSPLLGSPRPVLLCLPTDAAVKRGSADLGGAVEPPGAGQEFRAGRPAGGTFRDFEVLGENVVYSDMLAVLKISNVLALHHREYRVRLNKSTTLDDLRQGPTVLIGGLDNQWSLRAFAPLRFRFEGSDDEGYWVADTLNPGNKSWLLEPKKRYEAVTKDYALVARLHNEETGQVELIVAGIGMSGTAGAGEFLSDPQRLGELQRKLGSGFKDKDFEAVLSMEVVNGIPGSAKVVAVTSW